MTTHSKDDVSRDGATQVSERAVGRFSRHWVTVALATMTAFGCGARVNGGNTGSETHWLQACDADSDCGQYSCLCGICSRACDSDGQCDEGDNPDGQCTARDDVDSDVKCATSDPERICAPKDGQVTPQPAPIDGEICDGSDDIRLLTQSYGGGPLPSTYGFFGAYGSSFLAIDGMCNFWVSRRLGQVIVGSVTDRSVLEGYETTYYQNLRRFAAFNPAGGCTDAGTFVVADPSGVVEFTCGAQDPPAGWEDTRTAASELASALTLLGERSTGSLRAVFVRAESSNSDIALWPLDLDPSAWVLEESLSWDVFARPGFGVGFAAGERAETLRMAAEDEETGYGKEFSFIGAQGPQQLRLLLRDDIPPKVFAALDAARRSIYGRDSLGETCDVGTGCDAGTCMTRSEAVGGGNACNTCITPDDNGSEWACQSNADCCAGLTCCVDCGEKSGTCIAEPDPCEVCTESGANWQPGDKACLPACVPDSVCWNECRGVCSIDNCEACGRSDECWAAGCEIRELGPFQVDCVAPTDTETPPDSSCSIDATDPALPGVTVHLEADACTFASGQGGQFRYTVTFDQSLDFTTEASQGCGLCGAASELDTWVSFRISDGAIAYCPECDVGCCAPTQSTAMSLDAQSVEGTVDWPGLQWSGPSDTTNQPSGAFPPGSYAATVTVELPGLGEVVATLPVEVTE